MPTFMNSKLPHDWQMSKISSTDIHIVEDLEFIIHLCYQQIPLDHEIYFKCKKTSNLIKVIISALELKVNQQKKKRNIFHSVTKTFDFSQNLSVPFHQVTFYHSISCVLLIDKPNKSCRNSMKFERNAFSTTKKSF